MEMPSDITSQIKLAQADNLIAPSDCMITTQDNPDAMFISQTEAADIELELKELKSRSAGIAALRHSGKDVGRRNTKSNFSH